MTRLVFDTNVMVSALLFSDSGPGRTFAANLPDFVDPGKLPGVAVKLQPA